VKKRADSNHFQALGDETIVLSATIFKLWLRLWFIHELLPTIYLFQQKQNQLNSYEAEFHEDFGLTFV